MHRALARRKALATAPQSSKGIPSQTLNVFTRQWAALMKAGIPLSQAFELLGQSAVGSRATRLYFANTLQGLRADVLAGQPLHVAFQKYPKIFNAMYCNLLLAGEGAGILEKILSRLADTLEAQSQLKAKLKNAIIYPSASCLSPSWSSRPSCCGSFPFLKRFSKAWGLLCLGPHSAWSLPVGFFQIGHGPCVCH
jgi:type II secretory pathway component PulF